MTAEWGKWQSIQDSTTNIDNATALHSRGVGFKLVRVRRVDFSPRELMRVIIVTLISRADWIENGMCPQMAEEDYGYKAGSRYAWTKVHPTTRNAPRTRPRGRGRRVALS